VEARKHERSIRELVADAARALGEGDDTAVVAALNEAAERDSDDLHVHFVTSLAAWSLNDTARALQLAKACFERAPDNGTIAEIVASLAAQSGDLAESLYYGKLAIALPEDATMRAWVPSSFPAFEKAFLSIQDKPLLAQARLLDAGGELVQALAKARQHVDVAPDDAEGRQFCAELSLRQGEAAGAVEVLLPLTTVQQVAPQAVSLLASGLAAVGKTDAAARFHDSATLVASNDAAIAARRIADAAWIGVGEPQRAVWIKDWLQRFVRPGKARQRRPAGDKLVIGYFVSGFADRRDAAAIAAIAREHAQHGAVAVGYGRGEQSWSENAPLSGAFAKWRNIVSVDHATLAKMIAGDGVDVVIDAGGFAVPEQLRALGRLSTALRVAWIGEPRGLPPQIYDAAIAPRAARGAGDVDLWALPCGGYPLIRDWTRSIAPVPDRACRFGADVHLSQIDAATTALWRGVLAAVPDSVLLLRANDMAAPANVNRLIHRFGELAGRIDVIATESADDFYCQVDVAVAPTRGCSPFMAAAALASTVPVVALETGGMFEPYPALLRDLGLNSLVATGEDAYIRLAGELASREARGKAAAMIEPIAARGETSAAEIAAAIEEAARASLERAAA